MIIKNILIIFYFIFCLKREILTYFVDYTLLRRFYSAYDIDLFRITTVTLFFGIPRDLILYYIHFIEHFITQL